ncbi:MAG: hypothetical protein EOO65_05735 [Methanosarcinales archaeon]|nr:MAG: hypothetical protein EOO65_05735 [Methanosarcinales archaeon]
MCGLYTAAEGAAPRAGHASPCCRCVRVRQGHNLDTMPTDEFTDEEIVTVLKRRLKNRSAPSVDQLTADLVKGTVAVPGTATFKILK